MIAHWIVLAVAGLVLHRAAMPSQTPPAPPPTVVNFPAVEKQAAKVAEITERIQILERMIVDIEMTDPDELHTNFRTTWESGGKNRAYDFWSDGISGTSADMLTLATRERDRLRASLLEEIDRLYRLRCTQNYDRQDLTAGQGRG